MSDKRFAMMTVYEQDIQSFLEQIDDNDSAIRCDAIRMITGIKDGRILYPLIKSLQDDDLGVQQAAMDALIVYDDEAAVYNLLPLLSDKRVAVKNLTQEILEKTGGSGLRLLQSHIHDKDEDVRKMIADILGRLELPDAVPVLIEMLRDENDNVRSSAIEGLGRITDTSIVDCLIDLLKSTKNVDIQCMVLDALSQIGGEESIAGLLEVIDHVKPEIMDMAVMGMVTLTHGDIGSVVDRFCRKEFMMHLTALTENIYITDTEKINHFMQAFMTIGGSACAKEVLKLTEGINRDDTDLLNMAVDVVRVIGDENTLIKSLSHKNETRRLVSVRVLGLLRSEKALPELELLFNDAERDLKIEVLNAMGNIGGKKAFRFLTDRLSYGEGHIREAAVDALGSLASTDAIQPLLNRFQKEEYQNVIGKVAGALIEIGRRHKSQELAEGLIAGLYSKNPSVREVVVRGLGELKWIDSSEHICGLLNDEDWRVRRAYML